MKTIFIHSSPDIALPQRLDRYLRRHGEILQSTLEKACRQGKIKVNDQKTTPSYRVQEGDRVTLYIDLKELESTQSPSQKQDLERLIFFEDETFCVINKPNGLATQGGTNISIHLDGMLKKAGSYYLVHRLDRDTSGLLLVAKTALMSQHFACLFKNHKIEKTYHAITHGVPPNGLIDAPLLRQGENMIVASHGKDAKTLCQILEKRGEKSLVELKPLTGRTHQLRAHMQYINTPILGDKRYGISDNEKRLYLHAYEIKFSMPNGRMMQFHIDPKW
jgi:23S rRNA pseudouridine955/2504/2580 synthase